MSKQEYIICVLSLAGRDVGAAPFGFKGAGFTSAMRNALRRYYGLGHLHFVTFSYYFQLLSALPFSRNVPGTLSFRNNTR